MNAPTLAPTTFLEGAAKPLLVLHALVALATGGACTHMAIVAVRLWRGAGHLGRLTRIYSQIIGGVYGTAFAIGLLMYPHYRYAVRGIYLDRYAQWASNLFDIKENLAALGLPLAISLLIVGRRFDPVEEPELIPTVAFLSISVWAVVISNIVIGLVVTSVKGV